MMSLPPTSLAMSSYYNNYSRGGGMNCFDDDYGDRGGYGYGRGGYGGSCSGGCGRNYGYSGGRGYGYGGYGRRRDRG